MLTLPVPANIVPDFCSKPSGRTQFGFDMPDIHDLAKEAHTTPSLEARLALLAKMELVFARLSEQFPANPKHVARLDALRAARLVFEDMIATPEIGRDDVEARLETVRATFKDAGAREADLRQWGLF